VLSRALDDVNKAQLKADETTKQFLTGEIQDIHQHHFWLPDAKA